MFLDKVIITCKAGNGGNGCVSFFRDKMNMRGGPDGGDGGKGGDIIFKVDRSLTNLQNFRYTKVFRAPNGADGSKKKMTGKAGKDIVIFVPQGTVIRNVKTGYVLKDMFDANEEFVMLRGGRGGVGNPKFATSTRQTPNYAEPGIKTDEYQVSLELKTIADVGLVGFPNVGKSSILAAVSNAKPKIANYHFTTLAPNIGVVHAYDKNFVMADIPGLIEGASEGEGLGLEFLRHIERTRLLVHVIDIAGSEGRDPIDDYKIINNELKKYGAGVDKIPQIVALNKCDLLDNMSSIDAFKKKYPSAQVVVTSTYTREGLDELMLMIARKLETLPKRERLETEEVIVDPHKKKTYTITKVKPHYFDVEGELIDQIAFGVVLKDMTSFAYFQKRMKDEGIIDALKAKGMVDGDTIKVTNVEFVYME